MYIPTTFFSSQGSCISASASTINGSGAISSGTFLSGSALYQYYLFTMTDLEDETANFTASLNIHSGSTGQAKVLIVGGGGTGADQTSFTPQGSSITYDVEAAGGGGGGGVVYYNNFPLSSGSYQIGIAPAQASVQTNGKNSWIKLPNNLTYPAFYTNQLTAYGGGAGGKTGKYTQISPSQRFYYTIGPGTSGTGGGAGQANRGGTAGAGASLTPNGIDANGYQGYNGGDAGDPYPNTGQSSAGGGGGAGGLGESSIFPIIVGDGGAYATFNLTGTSISVGGGGAGVSNNTDGTITLSDYARGGNGYRKNGTNSYPKGTAGIVIISWPICILDSNNCKEYRISGGATGGTTTYIPCGTQTPQTTTIDFGYTGSVCTYNVAGYPTATGTVTLTQTGSCNSFIPIFPSLTCSGSQVKTPVYLYSWEVPRACYPSQTSCQRYLVATATINYVDYLGVSQSIQVGGGFGSNTGQVCARDFPTPTIQCGSVTGGFGNCAITKSGLVCAYYCSGSI